MVVISLTLAILPMMLVLPLTLWIFLMRYLPVNINSFVLVKPIMSSSSLNERLPAYIEY